MPRESSAHGGRARHGDDRANLELLLAQIADVPDEHRGAWFACAAALVLPAGEEGGRERGSEQIAEGRLDGAVVRQARGTNGFGYDPVFAPAGDTRTLAEYAPAEKDAISHRGRAFRALAPAVLAALESTP